VTQLRILAGCATGTRIACCARLFAFVAPAVAIDPRCPFAIALYHVRRMSYCDVKQFRCVRQKNIIFGFHYGVRLLTTAIPANQNSALMQPGTVASGRKGRFCWWKKARCGVNLDLEFASSNPIQYSDLRCHVSTRWRHHGQFSLAGLGHSVIRTRDPMGFGGGCLVILLWLT
jgi:hypothetical protein